MSDLKRLAATRSIILDKYDRFKQVDMSLRCQDPSLTFSAMESHEPVSKRLETRQVTEA